MGGAKYVYAKSLADMSAKNVSFLTPPQYKYPRVIETNADNFSGTNGKEAYISVAVYFFQSLITSWGAYSFSHPPSAVNPSAACTLNRGVEGFQFSLKTVF